MKTNNFCFEQCAATVKALGSLHCVEVVFSFGIDRSFSFSPKCEKHCNQCLFKKDMLVGDSCYGHYQLTCHLQLPSLPLCGSFACSTTSCTPNPFFFSSLCPFTPYFMHTHYICSNSFQVSVIWCSDISSRRKRSVRSIAAGTCFIWGGAGGWGLMLGRGHGGGF